jgi:diguanylate cyclase (GGDEF)-like protein/PAS domain S-box-containing protein
MSAPSSSLPGLLRTVAIYWLLCMLSLRLAGTPGNVASLWFASPVGSVALALAPARQWPGLVILLGLGNALANWMSSGASLQHDALLGAIVFTPGNLLEMMIAGLLLRRLPLQTALTDTVNLSALFLRGCLLPSLPAAAVGVALLHSAQPTAIPQALGNWISGGSLGAMAVMPLVVWLNLTPARERLSSLITPAALAAAIFQASVVFLAASYFRQPFVIIALGLLGVALKTSLPVVALISPLTAILAGLMIGWGILLPPASGLWRDDVFYYCSFIASLLPGLYLSVSENRLRGTINRLQESESRYRQLYFDTPVMMQSIDAQGRLMMVSRRWLNTFGYAEAEVIGRPAQDFLTSPSAHYAQDVVIPESQLNGYCNDITYQMRCKDGRVLDVLMCGVWEHDESRRPVRSMEVLQDVTEKNALAMRSRLAETDVLTGLPNRTVMDERLSMACNQARRHTDMFAVGFLDLDYFKQINDSYGHDAGDELLKEVGRRLREAIRDTDTVCRIGGDEFVLLVGGIHSRTDLEAIAHKIQQTIDDIRLRIDDGSPQPPEIRTACSLGFAVWPEDGLDGGALLAAADRAMYSAKRGGRRRFTFAWTLADKSG